MPSIDADVAVIGGGPAGAAAACLLARRGCTVLLLDPRCEGAAIPKPGDALPGAALRLLRACNLPVPSVSGAHRPNGGNVSVWGAPEPVYRDFVAEPDGPGWRLDRSAFEAELLAAARNAGTQVQPRALRDAQRANDHWHLRLRDGGSMKTRWLIDATGRPTAVARRLGAQRYRDADVVAVVGYARPDARYTLQRSLVETAPLGWWYAAMLPDRRAVFMLHTRPNEAARLRAAPEHWQAALAATHHVSRAFPQPVLMEALRCYTACGAWLEPVYGNGWVACGDAALSFDPCSAQGIFNALYGGMAAATAVQSALSGDAPALAAYAAQCSEIRRMYRQQVQAHYAQERRWPDALFWRAMHHASEVVATSAPKR